MGAYIRQHDWARTPLGAPSEWPLPLRTAVRIMLTTNHPVFVFWGPEHICLYNDAYSRSLGPEKHPSILGEAGKKAWPEIWDIIGPQIEYVMRGEGSTWHENHLVPIDRNGKREEVYWTYSFSPIDDPSAEDNVGGVLVLCTETTDQVLSAQRIKAAQERWQQLFEQAPGFMCIVSGRDHVFEFANPAYFRLVQREDIVGKPVREALPWAADQGFVELLDRVYDEGKPHTAYAAKVAMPGSEGSGSRYLDFVYQPIREENGEVSGIFVLGSDVTERKMAEEALRVADRRKDEFLATLAHELRNPLAPIQTSIELMRLAGEIPSTMEAHVQMIERQARHLVRLVADLLEISRINQGKVVLQREPLDLNHEVGKAVESCEAGGALVERKVQCSFLPERLTIDGDPVRIAQAVGNLLINAAKFTSASGTIHVSTFKEDERWAAISVRDDGVGISSDMLQSIFTVFVQDPMNEAGGLGIGLALVKSLIELHGGGVEARSAGLGEGAEFVLRLPLVEEVAESRTEPGDEADLRLDGLKCLVVDDNADAAMTLAMLLRVLGAEVDEANSGIAAMEIVRQSPPDYVLLDLGMPEMSGYEVALAIGELETPKPALIAVTGWGQEKDRQKTEAAGFSGHLVKPVSINDLKGIITLK